MIKRVLPLAVAGTALAVLFILMLILQLASEHCTGDGTYETMANFVTAESTRSAASQSTH